MEAIDGPDPPVASARLLEAQDRTPRAEAIMSKDPRTSGQLIESPDEEAADWPVDQLAAMRGR